MTATITQNNPFRVCFVCLGNICRSPSAEGIFQHLVNQKGFGNYFFIDSAGTSSYHIGEKANSKSRQVAQGHGVKISSRARQLESRDLEEFDLIIAMDSSNFQNIRRLDTKNLYADKIKRMRDYDSTPGDGDVPDPYYGGISGFENVFKILERSCENLLAELEPLIEK